MKTNYSNLWSPIVCQNTYIHTRYALNSFLKSCTSIQYEHKGSLQLTNGSQVYPKGLFLSTMATNDDTGTWDVAETKCGNLVSQYAAHTQRHAKLSSLLYSAPSVSMKTNAATVLCCSVIKWRRGVKTPNRSTVIKWKVNWLSSKWLYRKNYISHT